MNLLKCVSFEYEVILKNEKYQKNSKKNLIIMFTLVQ